MTGLPSFAAMVRAYPNDADPNDVFKLVGGKVQANHYPNSCVIRISRALNYAGVPIRRTAHVLTNSGADGKWYATRVREFDGYMRHYFGKPSIETSGAAKGPTSSAPFAGKRGTIEFVVSGWSNATGHFDLWDGSRCIHEDYFSKAGHAALWLAPP